MIISTSISLSTPLSVYPNVFPASFMSFAFDKSLGTHPAAHMRTGVGNPLEHGKHTCGNTLKKVDGFYTLHILAAHSGLSAF